MVLMMLLLLKKLVRSHFLKKLRIFINILITDIGIAVEGATEAAKAAAGTYHSHFFLNIFFTIFISFLFFS